MYSDSTGKIKSYLDNASLKTLVLSKLFFRSYSCPSGCGGCCPKFSLDYFEGSERWEKFKELYPEQVSRFVRREVNGAIIYTDFQLDNPGHHCRNLDHSNGRCKIHESNPFSCEFELNKFVYYKGRETSVLINRLFGRGWQMLRVDGERGALCEMLPFDYEKYRRDLALLKELQWISKLWGKKTKLGWVINFLEKNDELIKENNGIPHDIKFTGMNSVPK